MDSVVYVEDIINYKTENAFLMDLILYVLLMTKMEIVLNASIPTNII